MKLNLDKAREILEMLQEDTITPKQAKELVTLLVQLTEKQKQDLISKNEDFLSKVSQETFTQIQNALIEIKEKAHDNQLEVRQLTNKQKIAYESKMSQLEALIEEIKIIEVKNGVDGIDGKDGSPDKPLQIADKLNTLEEVIDQKVIKGLNQKITDLSSNIVHNNAKLYTGVSETRVREIITESPISSGVGSFSTLIGDPYDNANLTTALNALVPYTGATADVDLGTGSLILGTIKPTGGASTSINPNNRTLVDSLGTAVIDWSDPSAAATVKFASSYVSGTVTFDLSSTAGLDNVYTFPGQSGTFAMLSDIPTPPAFQTNGTPNGSQTLLNLIPGTNITLTDNGTGGVTIDATGIGQAQVLTLGLGA